MKNNLPAGTYIVKLEVPSKTEKEGVFVATVIDPIGPDEGKQIKLRLYPTPAGVENEN